MRRHATHELSFVSQYPASEMDAETPPTAVVDWTLLHESIVSWYSKMEKMTKKWLHCGHWNFTKKEFEGRQLEVLVTVLVRRKSNAGMFFSASNFTVRLIWIVLSTATHLNHLRLNANETSMMTLFNTNWKPYTVRLGAVHNTNGKKINKQAYLKSTYSSLVEFHV